MKKISLFLALCMVLGVCQMPAMAGVSDVFGTMCDNVTTEGKRSPANVTAIEVLNQKLVPTDEKEAVDEELQERMKIYTDAAESGTAVSGTVEEVEAKLVSLGEKATVTAGNEIAEEPIKTKAISYYTGTSIPTYTSVTGWTVRSTYSSDTYLFYDYTLNADDQILYMDYLIAIGWTYAGSTEADDESYIMMAFAKGSEVVIVIADFERYCTTIMFEIPTAATATSVSLSASSRKMIVGNEYELKATVYPSNASQSVTWSSSNTAVASVSSEGVVTAKKAGSTIITAKTSNNKTATCSITVQSLVLSYYPDTSIPTFTCITGKALKNTSDNSATGTLNYYYDLDAASFLDYVRYMVQKDGWVVDANENEGDYIYCGLVKGGAKLLLMAHSDGYIGLTFSGAPAPLVAVTGVTLNKTAATITVGSTETLMATVKPANATNQKVTWTSSNDNVASVSALGVVTGNAVGTATITAKTEDGNKTATCRVTVNAAPIAVTGISLNKTATSIYIGDTETLTATVSPSNAANKNVIWSSSNTAVASVSSSGLVTAHVAGTAVITAKTADGNKTATCTVTVKARTPLVEVGKAFGQSGKIVNLPIYVYNNPGTALISFKVNYNRDAMTLKGIQQGEIFSGEIDCNLEAYPFVYTAFTTSNITKNGILITLQFEIKEDCLEGEYDITLEELEGANIDEIVINFDCEHGCITVRDSLPGDVNGDGAVTKMDLLRLAKHFSGFTVEIDEVASDVNGDGTVTKMDLLRLAKYFSGFDVQLG